MELFLIGLDYETATTHNPALSPNAQSNSLFELDFMSKAGFRLGLAYKLFGKQQEKK